MLLRRINRLLWSFVIALATLLYLVEEWLWEAVQGAMRRFGRLPGIRSLEAWISGLSPAGAAVIFLLPTSLALPVKLIALHQIMHGHAIRGTLVIVAAKVLATALFARIYMLTQPALMQVRWFVAVHTAFARWRAWAYAQLEVHPVWRAMHEGLQRWRAEFKAWRERPGKLSRRWKAVQRLYRMRKRA
jgi:hypothetical protein